MLRYTDDNILLETPEKRKQAKDKFINERVDLIHNYRHIVENIIKEYSNEIDKYIIQRMNVVGKIEAENKCTTIVTNYGVGRFLKYLGGKKISMTKKSISSYCY